MSLLRKPTQPFTWKLRSNVAKTWKTAAKTVLYQNVKECTETVNDLPKDIESLHENLSAASMVHEIMYQLCAHAPQFPDKPYKTAISDKLLCSSRGTSRQLWRRTNLIVSAIQINARTFPATLLGDSKDLSSLLRQTQPRNLKLLPYICCLTTRLQPLVVISTLGRPASPGPTFGVIIKRGRISSKKGTKTRWHFLINIWTHVYNILRIYFFLTTHC